MKNKFIVFLAFVFLGSFSFAQSHLSTQAHQGAVSELAVLEGATSEENTVFSVGKDGFIIKWTEDGLGEHYQVSDVEIKMIARSPNKSDVAIYETDGASFNMVSVWNFNTLSRKCAFTFNSPVTSLSYSAKGTFVLCGTASDKGTYFLNTSNNTITSKKLKESTGAVNLLVTSESENTLASYSPTGSLCYYNLKTGEQKAKFYTESFLSQPVMFNNNVFLAGYKDGFIYIIQATNGKTVAKEKIAGKKPVIFSSNKNQNLYYITNENRQFKLYMIQNDRNKNVISPELIRTFTGIKQGEELISAVKNGENIFAGTNLGNIYKFDSNVAERVDVLQPLSDKMYDYIYDIASYNDSFYFLTPNAIFLSSYDNGIVDKKGLNPNHTNILPYGQNVILWTKDSRKTVQLLDFSTGNVSDIFTPEANIKSLKIYGQNLLAIEGSSSVNMYSISSLKKENLYNGTGIQDALLYSETDLYIAKTSATTPQVPLLYVNTRTKETVPLNVRGNVAYSLVYNQDMQSGEKSEIYGILISSNAQNRAITSLFSFNPSTNSFRTLVNENSEDANAICYLSFPVLYTNMGKSRIRSYNLVARRNFEYKRSASLPLKIAKNETRLVILNRDGSISWYNPDMNNVLADWYLTTDGQWFEF
ncbi:WD40 repeat domain-containing protein [Treponema pectinovorum]|uniref:WD40 repeat domain-containing protein n=1 Tax=Treponema pectinovorum TaxID=164 RepID=UPI0011CB3AD0|nr:WD40 repeat domain-containing protein [Treponema pectinovorum]